MLTTYNETLHYLYDNLPIFQRIGAAAYKADLVNTERLMEVLDHPERKFKSVHIAGTNGKGSSSHMIASILQEAGWKVGLYTSPHLKEFTERIRINGIEIQRQFVVDFVNKLRPAIETIKPSFFEITVAMAYEYFAQAHVDIAVIEVGLGGRLDSTNVITPLVSLITNISFDHKDLLGDTLQKIASEKAGIIKAGVPVIVSERQEEVATVFEAKALQSGASIQFAADRISATLQGDRLEVFEDGKPTWHVDGFPLPGIYQQRNVPGVVATIRALAPHGFVITQEQLESGLQKTVTNTNLKGRWQTVGENPRVICDTGHNEAGIAQVMSQLKREQYRRLFMIIGMVKDKDISGVLVQLPKDATYFFCEASIPRAMPAAELQALAKTFGLVGDAIPNVNEAIDRARRLAYREDLIFVGGSTFVVAEVEGL